MQVDRDRLLTIRATEQERDSLRRVAQQRGMTISDVVRTALARDGVQFRNSEPSSAA